MELVENRKEWAQYLRDHNMKVEVDPKHGLLLDAVHQSRYGALVINENIARHFAPRATWDYDPDSRERRLPPAPAEVATGKESAAISGPNWTLRAGEAVATAGGSRIRVSFIGNRIDLIGVGSLDGGKARILLDGRPAEEAPCFYAGPIVADASNARPSQGSLGDIGPHGIVLRENLVPQRWTIRVTDDKGGYRLTGSATGFDGMGNMLKPFTANSGQIRIPPELWRHGAGCVPFLQPWDGKILNRTGDAYTFNVYRACKPIVDFRGKGGAFRVSLFQALPNRSHVVELITVGDGKVTVKFFDVFEPLCLPTSSSSSPVKHLRDVMPDPLDGTIAFFRQPRGTSSWASSRRSISGIATTTLTSSTCRIGDSDHCSPQLVAHGHGAIGRALEDERLAFHFLDGGHKLIASGQPPEHSPLLAD